MYRGSLSVMIDKDARVSIGNNCFFNNNCSINAMCEISIGDGAIFGEGVKIYDHNHRFNDFSKPLKEQGYSSAPVAIGKHCWIASNVVILKGAVIGDNCVISAGAIVRDHVPSNTILKIDHEYRFEAIVEKKNVS
jgi:acetyltransferase-like isoleucine patch superfamily enzyme